MAQKRPKRKLAFVKSATGIPISEPELQGIDDVLARLIAKAYAADHPAAFSTQNSHGADQGTFESSEGATLSSLLPPCGDTPGQKE